MNYQDDLTLGFDAKFYKEKYSDLAHMSDEEALQHFLAHGFREQRVQNSVAAKEELLPQVPSDRPVLEIGPFGSPKVAGPHVRYADYLSTEELRKRAPNHGFDPEKCPHIDYVLRHSSLSNVEERFAAVFSSHCIEHQPDLVSHLKDVANVLEDHGRYFLVIPDKRFCFDHFIPESDIADVLVAYAEKRQLHSLRSILMAHSLITHSDTMRHWEGDHGKQPIYQEGPTTIDAAVAHYKQSVESEEYVDVHAWQFTSKSFHDLCNALFDMSLTTLKPVITGSTMWGRTEFCSILEKIV